MKKTSKKIKLIIAVVSVLFGLSLLTLFLFIFLNRSPKLKDLVVENVQITMEGQDVDHLDAEVQMSDFVLGVKINNGLDLHKYKTPTIQWAFVGETDSTISNSGLVHIGNTIQNIQLLVTVEGSNKVSVQIPFSIKPKQGTTLQSISAITKQNKTQTYIEGQTFDAETITVWGFFESYYAILADFTADNTPLTATSTDVLIKYGDKEFSLPISVQRKTLQSIEIVNAPNKVNYIETQKFDKTGLKVKAIFEYITEEVTDFVVDETTPLKVEDNAVVVSYTFNGVTKQTEQKIEVTHRVLTSITLSGEVKKEYVQGATFDKTGLIVSANYEEVESENVLNFVCNQTPLMSGTTTVQVSYTENGITKTANIENITVVAPYSQFRAINLSSPENVSLSWTYSYITDQLEPVTDYNTYLEHSLQFDIANGIYQVPVGAIVTITATNSAVSGFKLDGQQILLDYPNNNYSFGLTSGEDITIDAVELPGNRFVVRFVGNDKDKSFVYSKTWADHLREKDLQIVNQLFTATNDYYYVYIIGETSYSFSDMQEFVFSKKTIVLVEKKQIQQQSKTLTLNYYNNYSVVINEDVSNLTLSKLSHPDRAGYTFVGWSKTQNGTIVDDTMLAEYLASEDNNLVLYACWEKLTKDYTGNSIVGIWLIVVELDGSTMQCKTVFNADGSFYYEVSLDGQTNNSYTGLFSVEENVISILSVETDADAMLISKSDFNFELKETGLDASVFIIKDYSVLKTDMTLTKTEE